MEEERFKEIGIREWKWLRMYKDWTPAYLYVNAVQLVPGEVGRLDDTRYIQKVNSERVRA